MAQYEEIRLEKNGVVICYFAPNFIVTPISANNIEPFILPYARGTRAKDTLRWKNEITVQGEFESSEGLPHDHKTALETLFGKSPVTAIDQVNRLKHITQTEDGNYELYIGDNQYNAPDPESVDRENGIYPPVFVMEVRPPTQAGKSRVNYMVKFLEGFQI